MKFLPLPAGPFLMGESDADKFANDTRAPASTSQPFPTAFCSAKIP